MSLLMVRVPRRSLIMQESIDLGKVEFQWTFISDIDDNWLAVQKKTGIASVESMASMPQAAQVIIFMSTLDVRLIPMKIPLVSDEKIQMIMPGLLGDHLLGNIDQFDYKILNPLDGDPALDRTVAVIDKQWLSFISSKAHQLNARRVRLLPDCYLLRPVTSEQSLEGSIAQTPPNIAYEIIDDQLIWTVRLGEQTGASWIDQVNNVNQTKDISQMNHLTDPDSLLAMLPGQLRGKTIAPFDWSSEWVLCSLRQLVSLSDDDGVNLLSDSYHAANPKQSGVFIKDKLLNLFTQLFSQWSWSSNKLMLIFAPLSFIAGYIFYGAAILLINFSYNHQMNALLGDHLKESSGAAIQLTINHFLDQHHVQKRRAGELNQADFQMMSGDLRRLMKMYGDGGIKRIDYQSSSIEFELRADFLNSRKITSENVVSDAATLGMLVISLGENQFKLLPYAGLGYGL